MSDRKWGIHSTNADECLQFKHTGIQQTQFLQSGELHFFKAYQNGQTLATWKRWYDYHWRELYIEMSQWTTGLDYGHDIFTDFASCQLSSVITNDK